jgi:peptide/nickel transport system substrate-binding protein
MGDSFGRRTFLGGAGALSASLWLGGGLGCTRDKRAAESGPRDQEKPRYGGRIRWGVVDYDPAGSLDVHKPTGSASIIRGFALYAKLWEWSEDMVPRLALAEEAEPNADASSWTIRLKKGLEFHNGKTITADDVIFSVRRLTDPELATPYGTLIHPLDRNRIEKLDNYTVRLHAKEGLGYLVLPDTWVNFGGIVPEDYHPVTNPVGAGPYVFKEYRPGQRSLFTRFKNYYKPGLPYADELEIIDFSDQVSRLFALQSGQIDVAYAVAPELKRLVAQSAGARLVVSQTYGWNGFNMNLEQEPFRDPRVRQAFRLLTDRQELVRRVLNEEGRIANDLYSPQDPTFNHGIPQRPYDLAEAKALLKSAGYEKLSVELVAAPQGVSAAVVFAEQAKRAGVDVKVKKVDTATYNGPDRLKFQMSTGTSLGQSFLCTGLSHDAPTSMANRTNFRHEKFGALFNAAMKVRDVEQRKPLVHEAQQIQHELGGLLIWGFFNVLDAVSERVGGVEPERSHFSTWRFDKLWVRGDVA